jgi:hypothetical protein
MALSDLILFPYTPQEIYDLYKTTHKVSVRNITTLDKELSRLFYTAKSKDRLSQCILYDLYLTVHHPAVFKDNITGKRIEQRLSKIFALSTGDEIQRVNVDIKKLLSPEEIAIFDIDVLRMVSSNFSQKGDLFFFDSRNDTYYKLSIKSLVQTNTEINFGAFEFQSTVKGIPEIEEELINLQERARPIELEIDGKKIKMGLGSASQMSSIILYIKSKGKINEYLNRFRILLQGVYKDDFLIYIKDNDRFALYLIQNSVFIDIVLNRVANGFKGMRIEGNAIRLNGIKEFFTKCFSSYVIDIKECIPERNKIEKLLIDSNHIKLTSFREFISNSDI